MESAHKENLMIYEDLEMEAEQSKGNGRDNAEANIPSSHSNPIHERMQNLNPTCDASYSTDIGIPAEEHFSSGSKQEQADGKQEEGSCIIEALSSTVRVGYNDRRSDSSAISIPAPAGDPIPVNIALCRFESGKLIKQPHSLTSARFVVISHVWGNAQWRSIDGVEGEVLVSDVKAKFITGSLPKIIGEDWFWMDVLCVDQRNKAARIAVTQHIPTIFRSAIKTVVIRTDSGYQQCCAEQWRTSWKRHSRYEAMHQMFDHMRNSHRDDDCDEGVLTRLWPYQEILLSNHVQFVRCECAPSAITTSKTKSKTFPELAIIESLISTAITWTSYGEDDGDDYPDLYYVPFIDAFFELGTVERSNARGVLQFPLAQEIQLSMSNKRRTTKARDFILAIMPQFSFYTVPKNAKDMTFPALFFDCIRQLSAIGHALAPLIIRRTINFIESNTRIWETEIPEPTSLGEFFKLLCGPQISYPPRSIVPLYTASVRSVSDISEVGGIIGSDTDEELINASRALLTVHLVVGQMSLSQQLFKFANGDLIHILEVARSTTDQHTSNKECLIGAVETLIAIVRLFEQGLGKEEIAAWNGYQLITSLNSESDRKAVLLLTAMIACNIGISAFKWVQEHLQPIRVDLPYSGVNYSALALINRTSSLDQKFFLTDGGHVTFRMGGADLFKRWALFSTERLETGELNLCIFPFEVRFQQWDDGQKYVPGSIGIMAVID